MSLSHAPPVQAAPMLANPAQRLSAAFFALWLFIIFVSAIDGYLVFRYRHLMETHELNPVGRWLIASSGGEVWPLLALKLAGTTVACALLLLVYWSSAARGTLIAAALAVLQLTLLLFLLFG